MAVSNYDPGQELSSIDFRSMLGGPLSSVVDAQAQAALSTVDFIKAVGFEPDVEDETTGEITPGGPVYVHFKYPKQVSPYIPAREGVIDTISVNTISDAASMVSVVINSNTGEGANVTAVVLNDGTVDVTKINGGQGYNSNETITITYLDDNDATQTEDLTISVLDIEAVQAEFEEMKLEVPLLTMVPIPYLRVDEVDIEFNAKINSMEYRRIGSEIKSSSSFSLSNRTETSVTAGSGILTSLFAKGGTRTKFTNSVNFKVNASFKRTSKEGSKVEKAYQLGIKIKATQDETPGGMEKILNILEDSIIGLPANS